MVNTALRVSFVALLTAVAGAQSRSPSAAGQSMAPLALDAAISHAGATAAPRIEPLRPFEPQEPDYSLPGLFLQDHGDFMLKARRYRPDAEFSFALMPDEEIKGEPGSFDLYFSKADIEVPFYVASDAYVIVGAYGSNRHYQTRNMPLFGDENLSAAGLKFGFGAFLDNDVLLEVKVEPGVWSDMDGSLKHNDYDMPGSALLTWKVADDAFFKFGARYNQVYKEAPWLPYVGVSWAISENFRIDVLLPELVEISWWPNPSFGVLLGTEIDGAQYRVRTSAASGRQRANAQVQEITVYAGLISRLSDNFSITARGGANVAGDYHLTNGNTAAGYADGTLQPGLFAEISCGFDF